MPELITSVEPDPRGAGAARVSVNGRWFCTIPAFSVGALALKPGLPLDGDLRERLGEAADTQAAFRFVVAALGRRGFARRDLERRMVQKGHPRDAVQSALARAAELGLLDDLAFARAYAEAKSARGRGPARLLRDLFAMGVDRSTAEEAVNAAWLDGEHVRSATCTLAQKRSAQLGSLPRPVKRRRVLAYLARRGFSGREVREMVGRVVG
jgi:regulatory protein